jgi:hypothetical protein
MTDKPPKGFVMLPRELLESTAWRSLSINARRLLDYLMIEHMGHAGKRNGFLLAPWRQLVAFGIGDHFVDGAVTEAERVGLVDCRRGTGKRPSVYALTWLPLSDGSAPSNRWRHAVEPAKQQALRMPAKQQAAACQTAGTKPVVPANQQAPRPKSMPAKQQAPYRKPSASYHGKAEQGAPNGAAGAPGPAGLGPALHVVSPAPARRCR